ncbi:MAG: histone acetyltransferase [Xanthobacteraceae bacterium]|nr:histone acetyltransferase [Xanthobacteraceae bacterium]
MIFEPFKPFVASAFQIKFATLRWEIEAAAALRRAVFCEEQKIFSGDDRDAVDDVAIPIVALSMLGVGADAVVGTVRIHEPEPGVWWGSRLAVAMDHRSVNTLGGSLIKLAVSSAHARGCKLFLAHVQAQNVPLFRRMHWRSVDEIDIHGRLHHRMEADLNYYPPFPAPEVGFVALPKKVA